MGLHFVEAEFEFPTLVVEGDDLGSWIGDRIQQRGEQGLRAEAAVMVADGADPQRGGKVTMDAADLVAGVEFHELVAGAPGAQRPGGAGLYGRSSRA